MSRKSLCLCWELICTHITYPPLCLHIHTCICTSIFWFSHIKKYFVHFIISFWLSYSKGYTHTMPRTSPGGVRYIELQLFLPLMIITCHFAPFHFDPQCHFAPTYHFPFCPRDYVWRKAIMSTIISPGTNVGDILIKIQNFSFSKMHMKISSAKWGQFCPKGD